MDRLATDPGSVQGVEWGVFKYGAIWSMRIPLTVDRRAVAPLTPELLARMAEGLRFYRYWLGDKVVVTDSVPPG